tara:strand:- start:4481 stop:5740 length:1260 start_codon:yes stop_codon:yes gene_type:complete
MTSYIDDIKNILNNLDTTLEYNNIKDIYNFTYTSLLFIYPNFNKNLFKNIMNKLLIVKLDIDNTIDIKETNLDNINIPNDYKELVEHVEYIAKLPQPEQRTPEWFKTRDNMITASSCAQALNENPYPNQKSIDYIKEKVFGKKFIDNKYVHHGKKYEEIATKIYENCYNIKVDEFGLIPHFDISYLGASPDGICSYKTLDNNFSDRVGRMLEIKCPFSRKIKTKGKIDGIICPHYYWCQIQLQLECCDLDKCDFWQCEIQEIEKRGDWLNDDCSKTICKEEQNKIIYINNNCKKGCIIQLQPKNIEYNEFMSKYIYPDDINMNCYQYDQWVLNIMTNFHNSEYYNDYVFDKVLYWKLKKSHNIVISRDGEWFKNSLPKFKNVWDKVIYYRKNKNELKNLENKNLFLDDSSDTEFDDDEA